MPYCGVRSYSVVGRPHTLTDRGHFVWLRAVDRLLGPSWQCIVPGRRSGRLRDRDRRTGRRLSHPHTQTRTRNRFGCNVLGAHWGDTAGEPVVSATVGAAAEHRGNLAGNPGRRAVGQVVRARVRRGESTHGGGQ